MTVIELFGDPRVAAKLKKALYPQELVDKLDYLTKRVSALTENLRERDERIKQLEKKVETLELDSDKVEQYSRRSNHRFSGIHEADNDVEDTTEKILQIINDDMEVPVSRDQVERSHRLGPKVDRNGKARQRNIIIRFNRESVRCRMTVQVESSTIHARLNQTRPTNQALQELLYISCPVSRQCHS